MYQPLFKISADMCDQAATLEAEDGVAIATSYVPSPILFIWLYCVKYSTKTRARSNIFFPPYVWPCLCVCFCPFCVHGRFPGGHDNFRKMIDEAEPLGYPVVVKNARGHRGKNTSSAHYTTP